MIKLSPRPPESRFKHPRTDVVHNCKTRQEASEEPRKESGDKVSKKEKGLNMGKRAGKGGRKPQRRQERKKSGNDMVRKQRGKKASKDIQ